MIEPNKERILALAVALESGEYQQARLKLRRITNGYCCLGVGCDISGLGKWEEDGNYYRYVVGLGVGSYNTMAGEVQEWYGFAAGTTTIMMDMNDMQNQSFKQIAAWLREKYQLGDTNA